MDALLCYLGPIVAWAGLYMAFANQPRGVRYGGALVGLAGLVLSAIGFVDCFGSPILAGAVLPLGIAGILAGGRMITHPSPVYSAVYFGGVIVVAAVVALLLGATFLAAALLIVYGGAILVAYLFVIMLAQRPEAPQYDREVRQPMWATIVGAGLTVGIVWLLQNSAVTSRPSPTAGPPPVDNVPALGTVMYTDYAVVVEVAGLLLLIAIVGAIVLTSMRVPDAAGSTQEDAASRGEPADMPAEQMEV